MTEIEQKKTRQEPAVLQVKMFGGFDMTWSGGAERKHKKLGDTQFAQLMQIILHYRDRGVSRAFLEETLFGDRDLEDVHHTLQSVIYNAKKRLASMGLPPANYIYMEQGRFYWTKDVPVVEDAARFDELYALAEAAKTPAEALGLYTEACYCYTGEFLSMNASVIWAAQESRRYRLQFYDCMEKAVALLREKQDWFQMEALGIHGAKAAPFADWETVTMEALTAMGHYEEALRLYTDTVDMYFREQGLRPSRTLLDSLEKLSALMDHSCALLDDIQAGLEEPGKISGGYFCSYPVFQGIYHMHRRTMSRAGITAHLILCTIVDGKGNPMRDGAILESLSARLKEAICGSVRVGDAVCQYGKGQFLVLLMNATLENCAIVEKRIDSRFYQGRQRTGVEYNAVTVLCPDELL